MAGTNASDGASPAALPVVRLIGRLEAGSMSAAVQLKAAAEHSLLAPSTDERRPGQDLLDAVAASAAAGSPFSLELLLDLITTLDLAGPSLRRVGAVGPIADDVAQEVLVAVSRSIHRFRQDSRFTTWLFAVARNVAVSKLRRVRSESALADDDLLVGDDARRMSSLVTERDVVRSAVDTLPAHYREVIVLRDFEGCTYADIAGRLDLELNTVRSRLNRGRSLLAAHLA